MSKALPKVVTLIIALMLSGCIWIEDTADLEKFVAKIESQPKRPIQPLPEFKPYESFIYEGSSLRNPFEPLIEYEEISEEQEVASNGLSPDVDRPRDYLEQFAVDDLSMVGTIAKQDGQLWALVVDSNGEIHRVKTGDYIGLDFGEIISVSDQLISLVEIVTDGRGGWVKRPRSLILPETE